LDVLPSATQIDQLDRGTIVEDGITLSLKIITADGRTLQGQAAAAERLLCDHYKQIACSIILLANTVMTIAFGSGWFNARGPA
jgi:hypothetical protein